jgi:hypothetical protein
MCRGGVVGRGGPDAEQVVTEVVREPCGLEHAVRVGGVRDEE